MNVNDIVQLLIKNRLQEALNALQPFFLDGSQWELSKEYSDICNTYATLLDYFKRGVDDSERQRVHKDLVGRTLLLTDRLRIKDLPIQRNEFGVPSLWNASDLSSARTLLFSSHTSDTQACLLISSMTLSLMRIFDPLKVILLSEASLSEKDSIAIRAVTSLFICVRLHSARLPFYPDLQTRLQLLSEDSAFTEMLSDVELQFIRSLDTERIERKMKEEIIPSMLRNPKLKGKPFITNEDLTEDSDPDWEKWLQESGVEESIQELTEMQMNGADVYMATFSQLKGYPFFQKMENWFRPFDIHDSEITDLFPDDEDSSTLRQLILHSGIFCNSDKYSFCLTLKQLPKEQLKMLRTQMKEQEDAMREEHAETLASLEEKKGQQLSSRTLIRQYIQDLYRFFHLHYTRSQYVNPFEASWLQHTEKALYDIFQIQQKSLLAIIEMNARRKDYAYALVAFDLLLNRYPSAMDATLWQKLGLCRQQSGDLQGALEALRTADALRPDNYWTTLHMAQCYRDLGNYSRALEHYRRAEGMKPDNLQLTYQTARCLMEQDMFNEALPVLYKLAYHEPDSMKVMRSLLHALLMTHKPQNAEKYVETMLKEHFHDIQPSDWFTIGCQLWLTEKREEAVNCWKQMKMQDFDVKQMLRYGFDEPDLIYIRDLCAMKIQ
ncbi:MAG: tetratricopeptide repeat protein [Bacteroidaceae bacterium]|nr:tetratricopeptide repeat protein [Bacteroidaceae bacterium]